ncbi:unnamed protein product [Vitrella brassicaformis CCMP3155]|uniref:endo-1,4-beta-xylanase n=3 Tax=Vitrella brassicaformis TaxID=1169539 RepID=A0A0G4EQ49_VITBC|nr:unnamed protein product [Vitrella brassicaformis CCMP3155]|eukprot:CEL99728.1 unnamed protein product [Vitrella brassicaformis CCMP3155]
MRLVSWLAPLALSPVSIGSPIDFYTPWRRADVAAHQEAFVLPASARQSLCSRLGGVTDDRSTICCPSADQGCDGRGDGAGRVMSDGPYCSQADSLPCIVDDAAKDAFVETPRALCEHKLGGLFDGTDLCCPHECGRCGGVACDQLRGDITQCCSTGVRASDPQSCSLTQGPPCVVTPSSFLVIKAPTATLHEKRTLCRRFLGGTYDQASGVCCPEGPEGDHIDTVTSCATDGGKESLLSCDAASTTTPPCLMGDRLSPQIRKRWPRRRVCEEFLGGVFHTRRGVCCPRECGTCGGEGCALRADGRPDLCCSKEIKQRGVDGYCSMTYAAPCTVDDSMVAQLERGESVRVLGTTAAAVSSNVPQKAQLSNQALCEEELMGKFNPDKQACCPLSCGDDCGGNDACMGSQKDICCPMEFENYGPKCETNAPLPCLFELTKEQYCKHVAYGSYHAATNACCMRMCGSCEDDGCEDRDGGAENCCPSQIAANPETPTCELPAWAPCMSRERDYSGGGDGGGGVPSLGPSDIATAPPPTGSPTTMMPTTTMAPTESAPTVTPTESGPIVSTTAFLPTTETPTEVPPVQPPIISTVSPPPDDGDGVHDFKQNFVAKDPVVAGSIPDYGNAAKMYFGYAGETWEFGNPKVTKILTEEGSYIVAENECKMGMVQPTEGNFPYFGEGGGGGCREIMDLANDHQLKFRHHTFVWHTSMAGWMLNKPVSQRQDMMLKHIEANMDEFVNDAFFWCIDVVNEVLNDVQNDPTSPKLRSGYWGDIPSDWVAAAFKKTHEMAVAAGRGDKIRLFINDYSINSIDTCCGIYKKANAMYHYAQQLLNKGVVLHGVGLQCHINIDKYDWDGVRQQMDQLGRLGLEVHITELDISCGGFTASGFQKCSRGEYSSWKNDLKIAWQMMVRICLAQPNCTAIGVWGVRNSDSWLRDDKLGGDVERPLLYDDNGEKTDMYAAVVEALKTKMP